MNEKQRKRMLIAFYEFVKSCETGDISEYFPIDASLPIGGVMLNFTAEVNGFPASGNFIGSGLVFRYKGQCYA